VKLSIFPVNLALCNLNLTAENPSLRERRWGSGQPHRIR